MNGQAPVRSLEAMASVRRSSPRQVRRLAEELAEAGLDLDGSQGWHELALAELDYAVRPYVHERRIPPVGSIVEPTVDPGDWAGSTALAIERRAVGERSTESARRYADGLSSWLIRRVDHRDEWAVFDRPAGSERDLVVLADALGAVLVQRHPEGTVRIVGDFGVFRSDGLGWHHEPLVASWVDAVEARSDGDDRAVLETILAFAVHDLGSRGVRAEAEVDAYGGTRHTAARRYSFDDPDATVIVVSEDGPVTVMRAGQVLGASARGPEAGSDLVTS